MHHARQLGLAYFVAPIKQSVTDYTQYAAKHHEIQVNWIIMTIGT